MSTLAAFHGLFSVFLGKSLSVQVNSYVDGWNEDERMLQCKKNSYLLILVSEVVRQ